MKTLYYFMTGLMLSISMISNAQDGVTNDIQPNVTEDKLATAEELPMLVARYYYYPNLDAYFDSKTNLFIYEANGEWIKTEQIASGYRGYSIYNGTNFPIDYKGDKPFDLLSEHQKEFPKKYSAKRQPPKEMKEDSKVASN